MTTITDPSPAALAAAWLAADPDADTRAETRTLLDRGDGALADAFGGHLAFGTAGLRGTMGPGPNAMNRVLVRVVAAAVADTMSAGELGAAAEPLLVIGYDARHKSDTFALDTARVAAARGLRSVLLPGPLPTPVLAFAVRHLSASAGVMVTASHNPRTDNGYKVYGPDGALLGAPGDVRIADRMAAMRLLSDADLAPTDDVRIERASSELVAAYLEAITSAYRPRRPRPLTIAYTALHGVGTDVMTAAVHAVGFDPPLLVPGQCEPDPEFPSTAFPNPEEPGALDGLLALATEHGADIALANDPDADRLAVAVPDGDGWRLLTGDELGCLLADHLLSRPADDDRPALVLNTVVSSRLLARIAERHGATHAITPTGFKWIMAARAAHPDHRLVCGYEEALGYAVDEAVHDKDGISAALAVADLAATLRAEGRTVLDRLRDLQSEYGVVATGQRSIRLDTADQAATMARLRADPPAELGDEPVAAAIDLRDGTGGLPATDAIVVETADSRIIVRPSGTEPKLKIYGESTAADGSERSARARLRADVGAAADLVCAFDLPDPDRSTDASSQQEATAMFEASPTPTAADLELIVRTIDLTTLEGDDTHARVRALCATARRPDPADASVGPVAAVCVYPAFVPLAREMLDGTSVAVATVAGAFPHGLSSRAARVADIAAAVEAGADEIDIVIDRSLVIEDRFDQLAAELAEAREIVGERHLKVIIEVGELPGIEAIRAATRTVVESGADFVKTSTGKAKTSATPAAVAAMADVLAECAHGGQGTVGLKVAGGVRTAADAMGYVHLVRDRLGANWVHPDRFRFGASSLLGDVLTARDG